MLFCIGCYLTVLNTVQETDTEIYNQSISTHRASPSHVSVSDVSSRVSGCDNKAQQVNKNQLRLRPNTSTIDCCENTELSVINIHKGIQSDLISDTTNLQ